MTYRKRKADSDSVNLGSNPSSPATKKTKRISGFRASKATRKSRKKQNRQRTRAARKSAQRVRPVTMWAEISKDVPPEIWGVRWYRENLRPDLCHIRVIVSPVSRSAGRARA